MFPSKHMPCPDCGASLDRHEREDGTHECEMERWLDYQVFQLRAGVFTFELELECYLLSPHGQFDLWDAERQRRRAA
jgi:hypothetical protein